MTTLTVIGPELCWASQRLSGIRLSSDLAFLFGGSSFILDDMGEGGVIIGGRGGMPIGGRDGIPMGGRGGIIIGGRGGGTGTTGGRGMLNGGGAGGRAICGGGGGMAPDDDAGGRGMPGGGAGREAGGGGTAAEEDGGPEVGTGPIFSPGWFVPMMPFICWRCLI